VIRALLVTNPHAGNAPPACDAAWLHWRLSAMDWEVLTGPGLLPDAPDATWQQAIDAADRVVVMGGDGTIRRLLPYLSTKPKPLAILPCGTGNDLARSLGIPLDPVQAIEIARSGAARRIDLAEVNGHLFVNVASLGVSAAVSVTLQEETKRRFGTTAYRMAAVREIWRRPPLNLSLFMNGHHHRLTAYQVSIANGVSFGGGWRIADDASLDDHTLDIVVLGRMTIAERWRRWRDATQGSLAATLASATFRAPSCCIEADGPLVANLDGDPVTLAPPLRFRVRPCALSVMVPATTLALPDHARADEWQLGA
jgi:YegS/Rv2252/BmrU family lipid kinase